MVRTGVRSDGLPDDMKFDGDPDDPDSKTLWIGNIVDRFKEGKVLPVSDSVKG